MGIKTMLVNMFLIFLFTVLSILGVFLEYMVIIKYFYNPNPTAHFKIQSNKTVYEGELFPIELVLDGLESPINAVQLDMDFNPERLEVVDFVTKDSFVKIFVDKTIDNNLGYVRVSGGIPNPGYTKSIGLFGNLMVRAKATGVVTLRILPSSAVLLNDGYGTNIMKNYGEFSYLVLPQEDTIPVEQAFVDQAFILGAQAEADKEQLNFFREDGTIYPVKTDNDQEIEIRTNSRFLEFVYGVDSFVIKMVTLSF